MPLKSIAALSRHSDKKHPFLRFAKYTSVLTGHSVAFVSAVIIIVIWGVTGPTFGFSDTWQLVINTGTTIVTFLMVFLIQNTQNRDTQAIQIKLDELIRATKAHNALMDLEELTEKELDMIRHRYRQIAEAGRRNLRKGKMDTDSPEI